MGNRDRVRVIRGQIRCGIERFGLRIEWGKEGESKRGYGTYGV
jgi:hypothetical protein